jgi:hydrogenase/urease accessory protein HupE
MRVLGALALLSVLPALVAAHPLEPSLLELHEDGAGWVRVVWTTPPRRVPGVVTQVVLPPSCRSATAPEVSGDADRIVTRWSADCGPAGLVGRRVGVTDLAETRSEALVRILFADGRLVQGVLTGDAPEITVPERPSRLDVASAYLQLGVHHILAGLDHLAFVLGLLLLVGGRSFLPAVTAFTVGHSVTLSLAVLGLVHVSQRPVEVLIAASVFVLALELARDRERPPSLLARRPWLMAGAFGLLHGFGFAGALSEAGLPEGEIPLALGAFNLGIELGQVAVVLPVFALGLMVRGSVATGRRWQRLIPAYAIGSMAFLWVLQRTVGLLD